MDGKTLTIVWAGRNERQINVTDIQKRIDRIHQRQREGPAVVVRDRGAARHHHARPRRGGHEAEAQKISQGLARLEI
jgi:hypothetical protein